MTAARSYRIRPARPDDCPRLPAIERAAAELFEPFEALVDLDDVGSVEWFEEAEAAGLLWVAVDEDDAPVAFVLFELSGGVLHLEEVDVHPVHARNGLGARLIDTAAGWARDRGHSEITLTTFREIPWNAPYYERIGFRVLARDEWTPSLVTRVADEARRGLDPEERVVMRRPLRAEPLGEGGT